MCLLLSLNKHCQKDQTLVNSNFIYPSAKLSNREGLLYILAFLFQAGDRKKLLSSMLMTAADVAAIAKPWELQHETAKQVADEFFDQGDMERMQLGINPMWMMDRERKDELPQMQVKFFKSQEIFSKIISFLRLS